MSALSQGIGSRAATHHLRVTGHLAVREHSDGKADEDRDVWDSIPAWVAAESALTRRRSRRRGNEPVASGADLGRLTVTTHLCEGTRGAEEESVAGGEDGGEDLRGRVGSQFRRSSLSSEQRHKAMYEAAARVKKSQGLNSVNGQAEPTHLTM